MSRFLLEPETHYCTYIRLFPTNASRPSHAFADRCREHERKTSEGAAGTEQPRRLCVIALTALSMAEDVERGVACGFDDFVSKYVHLCVCGVPRQACVCVCVCVCARVCMCTSPR